MDKIFDPRAIEARWCASWEQNGYAQPETAASLRGVDRASLKPYSIVIPPPNVTGTLHMGHAFQHAVMDALTRYHRMLGCDTAWIPGTDHAGIATQMVVERQLAAQGIKRTDLGRDKFLEKVWEWKEYSGGTITNQIRRMGNSVDWSREHFTMDDTLSRAVTEEFVRLHAEGLIYRGKRLVNWDPVLLTAISDLEVESKEENGKLWHFRYPLASGSGHLVVATTRPETMLGDSAVAVHPEDDRYKHLIGQSVRLPLCDREIPIIGDDYVDREFGTGVVKITPAHDFNDYAVGQRHALPVINVFTPTAHINDEAPAAYRGLDRYDARTRIVEDLEKLGLVDKIDDHKLMVPRGDRSGVVVEPYLTDQWFVDMKTLAERSLASVEDGRTRFVPENWINTYKQWLNNIQDWCISRNLWWGHRIPAWYDDAGNIYVGRSEDEIRANPAYASTLSADTILRRDEDTFDTWFSSALWPFSTLGWPEQTEDLKRWYPTNVLVTGFDIIFFWVARMSMMGLHFMGEVPFREVYITGLVRDAEGNKMSKSKGNVLDPLDLVDGISLEDLVSKRTTGLMQPQMAAKIEAATRRQYPQGIEPVGVDALRFTFLALASTGRDIRFDSSRASGYRNFCNKIWNAARFVLMQCEDKDCGQDESLPHTLSAADRWIVSRLQKVEAEVAELFRTYRFDLLSQTLYQFVWNEYCDWYLELSKPALQDGDAEAQRGSRRTLVRVLETILRLLHPLMPFITEEVWQRVAPLAACSGETLMLAPYPVSDAARIDENAEADIEWLKGFILGIRQIRGEMDISPAKTIPVLLQNASASDRTRVEAMLGSIRFLAKVEAPRILESGDEAPQSATALLGQMSLLVPMAGLIDKEAELVRLSKQIAKLESDLEKTTARLSNPNFGKAPEHVQQQTRDLVAKQQQDLDALRVQHGRIESL
ncbi:valine--tRNA ligase [Sinimarinibacterium sp. CAU 1509]|uniref:valine--tRNA ligase n=1 Tax=Sinimarinibacterium sp. CAU 1509 TaxID=2562283 RepID=UPI0010ABA397|nr:valine--tRNA ligase [Sinimarinibacterium sp. CAU 1509]TJY61116.1 valine--tRNA ligase [Sinimarinibacterium sp. CAU 1509]